MLLHESTNMNMSGASSANETTIASFNGNYGGNNDLYIHVSISDYNTALTNLDTLNADIAEFIARLLENIVDLND